MEEHVALRLQMPSPVVMASSGHKIAEDLAPGHSWCVGTEPSPEGNKIVKISEHLNLAKG